MRKALASLAVLAFLSTGCATVKQFGSAAKAEVQQFRHSTAELLRSIGIASVDYAADFVEGG